MKLDRIDSNTVKLTFFQICNCYLVRETDGFTLIDASVGDKSEQIIAAAKEIGGQINRILLTHAHMDHIGSVDGLHHLLGKVEVAIGQREAPFLHKSEDGSLRPDTSLRQYEPQHPPKGIFPGALTRATHTLTGGELYGSLRCIATPGHTPGHMSYLDERSGTLFTGDALQSIGGLSVITQPPWYFPMPKMATWDKDLAMDSARHLLNYTPKVIATGHGRLTPNGTPALRDALQRCGAV